MVAAPQTIRVRPYAPTSITADWVNRSTRCVVGLAVFSAGLALFFRARLGLAAWDVFHQGLADHLDVAVGTVIVGVGLVLLVVWIPLRQRPGIGTILNAIEIGVLLDLILPHLPSTRSLPMRLGELAVGLALVAIGSAVYIGSGLGAGPRDGIMMGLEARGMNLAVARTGIEVTVLVAGLALGGRIGIGTVVFTFGIGPAVQLCLPWFALPARAGAAVPDGDVLPDPR